LPRLLAPRAVGRRDICADSCVLGHIAIEAIVHLDLRVLDRDVVEALAGLRAVAVSDGGGLQQRLEGN